MILHFTDPWDDEIKPYIYEPYPLIDCGQHEVKPWTYVLDNELYFDPAIMRNAYSDLTEHVECCWYSFERDRTRWKYWQDWGMK